MTRKNLKTASYITDDSAFFGGDVVVSDSVIIAAAGIGGTILGSVVTLVLEPWRSKKEAQLELAFKPILDEKLKQQDAKLKHDAAEHNRQDEVDRLRRALYSEMAFSRKMFFERWTQLQKAWDDGLKDDPGCWLQSSLSDKLTDFAQVWHEDVYSFAKSEILLFYKIEEAPFIEAFYKYLGTLALDPRYKNQTDFKANDVYGSWKNVANILEHQIEPALDERLLVNQ